MAREQRYPTHRCPTHGTRFLIDREPCWPCFVAALYGGPMDQSRKHLAVTIPPADREFWQRLEAARGQWYMLTPLESLRREEAGA